MKKLAELQLLRDADARFRALPWKLAAFGLTALLGAGLALAFFAWRQGYFEDKTPIYFISDTGTDLRIGMAVKFSGFKIGEVTDLKLEKQGQVGRVRIATLIEDRHLKWVKADSIGRVGKEGFIGDSYIDVGIGDPRLPPVEHDTELEFMPAKSLDDVLREVRDRAVPVFDQVELLIRRINDPQGDLNQTLANLRKLSADLHATRGKVDAALGQVDRLAGKEVPATLASARQALERADRSLQSVEAQLPALLQRTDRTLGNLEAASATARQALDAAAPDAVGLVRDSRELARKGNETVDAVSGAWPLKSLLDPPSSRPPRSDSQGAAP